MSVLEGYSRRLLQAAPLDLASDAAGHDVQGSGGQDQLAALRDIADLLADGESGKHDPHLVVSPLTGKPSLCSRALQRLCMGKNEVPLVAPLARLSSLCVVEAMADEFAWVLRSETHRYQPTDYGTEATRLLYRPFSCLLIWAFPQDADERTRTLHQVEAIRLKLRGVNQRSVIVFGSTDQKTAWEKLWRRAR